MPNAEQGLMGTTDAMVWAEEFCRIFDGSTVMREGPDGRRIVNEGTMVAWLANAIEVGRNAGRKETCPHERWHEVSEEMRLCTTCGQASYGEVPPPKEPFVTYAMADGELIWGEFSFTTTLDGFEDRDDEVKLTKRTYRLISEEEVVLPDPYPIEEEDDDDDEVSEAPS